MAQTTKRGAAQQFFMGLVEAKELPKQCIIWPFARNRAGYAIFGKPRGKIASHLVSRVVCCECSGLPPWPNYEAAHTCGNGHLGCVNPQHIEWKTSKQNKADQLRHGTRNRGERNGMARLTAEDVARIRKLGGVLKQRLVAEMFGIDQSTVSNLMRGERWGHVQ